MLTKVTLEGAMGKKFGRTWHLDVNSPNDALRMIDANVPGVFRWIKNNLDKYSHYRVICEYEDGSKEFLNKENYILQRKIKSLRYVPVISGAGSFFNAIIGIALIVVGGVTGNPALIMMGASMVLSSFASALTPTPKTDTNTQKTSYNFNGPENTTQQGVPVQLVYGRVLVGSHSISAALTVDQLL